MSNIRRRLQHCGKFQVYSRQSTIYVEPQSDSCDMDEAYAACKQIFGIISVTRARPCEKDKDAILDCAKSYLDSQLRSAKSFKVETKRSDKKFPMNSMDISQYVGGLLHDAYPHLIVDVHNPELCVHVEVREKAAYVHGPAEPGAGGLPHRHGRQGGEPPLRRHRQPRILLYDRQAGGTAGAGPLLQPTLHLPAGQGEGH